MAITGTSTNNSSHLASPLNWFSWYLIFVGREKDPYFLVSCVLVIRWRLLTSDAEPSSNFFRFPTVLPRQQSSWGQHGAHLGPVGPRWAPCWSHEPCKQGSFPWFQTPWRSRGITFCDRFVHNITRTVDWEAIDRVRAVKICWQSQLLANALFIGLSDWIGEIALLAYRCRTVVRYWNWCAWMLSK